jgi:hypothetical protein
MLSLAKARKDYYLKKVGEISPREDYYLRGGTATGHWHGSGASELGLAGTVSAEGLVRLFDGQDPQTGEQLGRRLRKDGVAAWDLTFSADKSVSLLWAFGDAEVRKHVVEAFEDATAEALAYLESMASSTRGAARVPVVDREGNPILGDHGQVRHRVETWPIRSSGYVAAWFTEFTSRADDPQLHTHVVVGNRVQGSDGVWRAIDGRLLYRHQLDAGYLHEAELRSRLTERLGVSWQPTHNGMADIAGFTREQIETFSQRRKEIEDWRAEHGFENTPSVNEAAALATRTPKQDHPLDALMPVWLDRGAEVGVTPESVANLVGRGREVAIPDPEPILEKLASPEGLTAQVSTFALADVVAGVAEALPEGGRRAAVEGIAGVFLRRPDVIPILPAHRTEHARGLLPGDLETAELDQIPELATPVRIDRRWDREPFPGLLSERRYTTAEILSIEQRIVERAQTSINAGRWTAAHNRVDAALRSQPELTHDQQAMVRQFAGSGNVIDIGVGAAGTGKTTVMRIIGNLANQTRTTVVGTALAARAAAGFETATGIPSSTITRFLWETREPGGLPFGAIVVVDEAGMVGTRQLAEISDLVERAQGKLILIGDHRQLAEIDAGGLFSALAARLPAVELTENVRQKREWERSALAELRHGSISRALAMYDRRGLINLAASPEDTLTQAVDAWYDDVREVGAPAEVLLIADRNDTVHRLNRRARVVTAQAGLITGPSVVAGDRQFQAGDRVVCLKNRTRLGVLNGDLATVAAVDTDRRTITLHLDRTDHPVTIPSWYLDEGNLDWGYALTGHKAQGATARRAHTVVGTGVEREWIYVTMSRGREVNTVYLTAPDIDHEYCIHLTHQLPERLPALVAALGRTASESAALDSGRGPQLLSDDELSQTIVTLEESRGTHPDEQIGHELGGVAGEYSLLVREAEARHQDRVSTFSYAPPPWIVSSIGERPSDPNSRGAWDRVVDRSLRYREAHGVAEGANGLIGPQPERRDVGDWAEWRAWHRTVEPDLRALDVGTTPTVEAVGLR